MNEVADAPVFGELLYEYTLDITRVTEYGVGFNDLTSGVVSIPPEGARFDVWFEGPVHGDKLSGEAQGVDYLFVRADGRMDLHVHAEVKAAGGQMICLFADGTCNATLGNPVAQLRENVRLFSSHPEYTWINTVQIWGVGTVDLAQGKIHIRGYKA